MFTNLIKWEISQISSIKHRYSSVRKKAVVGNEIVYLDLAEHSI
jgi:hypothetical protein